MLTGSNEWVDIAEVNPPTLPTDRHLKLEGAWRRVLITDNAFGKIRVSPYAFAARITHDVPAVAPTVVASTRDCNILAIESEVRGALGNGVRSFLVVVGDTRPQVEHMSHHYEIVEHLRELQSHLPKFEAGMTTRFRDWQFQRRIDAGAEFFVAGPVIDPTTVASNVARLKRDAADPPVYLMVVPPPSAVIGSSVWSKWGASRCPIHFAASLPKASLGSAPGSWRSRCRQRRRKLGAPASS